MAENPLANIPPMVVEQYRRRFNAIDLNKDGMISLREMAAVAKVFGYHLTIEELQIIFGKKDLDQSGGITFDEFCVAMVERQKRNKAMEPLRARFREYDRRSRGYITADDAFPILKRDLGFDMNKTETLIDMFDKNRNYRLSMFEFIDFIAKVDLLKTEVQNAFKEFDRNGDGYVNFEEAGNMMKPKGFSDDEVIHFFKKYDEDADGRLNYSEFARFWDVPLF